MAQDITNMQKAASLKHGQSYCNLQNSPVANRLLLDAQSIWQQFYNHPFVKGIGDGSLDIEKFQFYLLQDYLYLLDYAKIFAMGIIKSPNEKLMQLFESSVHIILNEELEVHKAYMKRLNISERQISLCKPALANTSYISYMLDIANRYETPEIFAAILSCALSYEDIANYLIKNNSDCLNHKFYGEWVKAYADPKYHADNMGRLEVFETLTKNLPMSRINYLSEIFYNCSRYELEFWNMAWMQKY